MSLLPDGLPFPADLAKLMPAGLPLAGLLALNASRSCGGHCAGRGRRHCPGRGRARDRRAGNRATADADAALSALP